MTVIDDLMTVSTWLSSLVNQQKILVVKIVRVTIRRRLISDVVPLSCELVFLLRKREAISYSDHAVLLKLVQTLYPTCSLDKRAATERGCIAFQFVYQGLFSI